MMEPALASTMVARKAGGRCVPGSDETHTSTWRVTWAAVQPREVLVMAMTQYTGSGPRTPVT